MTDEWASWTVEERTGAVLALREAADDLGEIFAANQSVDLLPWLRERADQIEALGT